MPISEHRTLTPISGTKYENLGMIGASALSMFLASNSRGQGHLALFSLPCQIHGYKLSIMLISVQSTSGTVYQVQT